MQKKRKEKKIMIMMHHHHLHSSPVVLLLVPCVDGSGGEPRSCRPSCPDRGCTICLGSRDTGYGGGIDISVYVLAGWSNWRREAWFRCRRQYIALHPRMNHWGRYAVVGQDLMRASWEVEAGNKTFSVILETAGDRTYSGNTRLWRMRGVDGSKLLWRSRGLRA